MTIIAEVPITLEQWIHSIPIAVDDNEQPFINTILDYMMQNEFRMDINLYLNLLQYQNYRVYVQKNNYINSTILMIYESD